MSAHRVVIVRDGFGGLEAARGLRGAPVENTLIDRRNFHLFQPLTYQVATVAPPPGEVAYPLRAVFKRNRNARVLLAGVARFDPERRKVVLPSVACLPAPEPEAVPCDTLIVAGGSHYSHFGHDEWSAQAAEVKSDPAGGRVLLIDAADWLITGSANPPLAGPMTEARKEPLVFVELDTRHDAGCRVSLEWDRDTGETQIVVADIRDASLLAFPVLAPNAGDAFRHPFRYAP
jgi:hypothetical protein